MLHWRLPQARPTARHGRSFEIFFNVPRILNCSRQQCLKWPIFSPTDMPMAVALRPWLVYLRQFLTVTKFLVLTTLPLISVCVKF